LRWKRGNLHLQRDLHRVWQLAQCHADAAFGRQGSGGASCPTSTGYYDSGMCHMFWRVTPANVRIEYHQTGLGYAGRPGGPVPTITVQLQGLLFQYFFLGRLMGFADIYIGPMTTTMTGEDLSFSAPPS